MHNAVVELQGWKRTCQLSLSLSPSVVCHFRHTENKSDLCKAAMSKSRTDFAPQVNILRLDANDVLFCANRWWYNLIIWTCLLLLLPLLYSHQGLFASDMQVFKAVENLQCSYCRESKGSTSLHSVKTWCPWCADWWCWYYLTTWTCLLLLLRPLMYYHQKLFAPDMDVFRAVVRNQVMGTVSKRHTMLYCSTGKHIKFYQIVQV